MRQAARRKRPTTSAQFDVERSAAIFQARQQFLNSAINMGWQLALTVIVPVIIGVKLDDHFHSTPSYTLAALVLAVFLAVIVVGNTLKQVRASQAAEEDKK
jgi:F0F1-type ATP synthase assembly protein I